MERERKGVRNERDARLRKGEKGHGRQLKEGVRGRVREGEKGDRMRRRVREGKKGLFAEL